MKNEYPQYSRGRQGNPTEEIKKRLSLNNKKLLDDFLTSCIRDQKRLERLANQLFVTE